MNRPNTPQDIKIAYLVLAHNSPYLLVNIIDEILYSDRTALILVHFDLNALQEDFLKLSSYYQGFNNVVIIKNRIKCYWGTFSLVQATLNLLTYALKLNSHLDYFYLLSGSCYPVKAGRQLKNHLFENWGCDFIEVENENWVKAGMRKGRYLYHHIVSLRKYPKIFKILYKVQRYSGLTRTIPQNIQNIKFGSQWWCLKRQSIEFLIYFLERNKNIIPFFKTVWIPDECFFQTCLAHNNNFNPSGYSLTYYEFDNYGKPKVYEVKNLKSYKKLDRVFFIRKISF